MIINSHEVERYLGYKGTKPTEEVAKIIENISHELLNTASPKYVYDILPLSLKDGHIKFGTIDTKSNALYKNLYGCEQVVVFAATLGSSVDMLITKYSYLDITRAVILQACATAMIEEYCDDRQKEIETLLEKQKLYLRPRFSPGYGDFNIKNQKNFINILQCSKRIGLSLTNSLMLVPTKSVTAVMGVTNSKDKCHIKGCEVCNKKNCLFRRES